MTGYEFLLVQHPTSRCSMPTMCQVVGADSPGLNAAATLVQLIRSVVRFSCCVGIRPEVLKREGLNDVGLVEEVLLDEGKNLTLPYSFQI